MDIKEYKVGMLNEKNQSIYDDGIMVNIKRYRFVQMGDVIVDTENENLYDVDDFNNGVICHLLNHINKKYAKKVLSEDELYVMRRALYDFIRCGDESVKDMKICIDLYSKVDNAFKEIRRNSNK